MSYAQKKNFILTGRSLAAALELRGIRNAIFDRVSSHSKNLTQEVYRIVDAEFAAALDSRPDLQRLTGIDKPSTVIYKTPQGHPRAYREYPELFVSYDVDGAVLMAPVDYTGRHAAPEESDLVTKENKAKESQILGSGWDPTHPIIERKRQGCALPADYDPATATLSKDYPDHRLACFRAGGLSLAAMRAMEAEKKAHDERGRNLARLIADEIVPDLLASKAFFAFAFARAGAGKPDVRLHISTTFAGPEKTHAAQINIGSRKIGLKDNDWFGIVELTQDGSPIILPRQDTPQGQKLKAILDQEKPYPSVFDYPRELGMAQRKGSPSFPNVEEFRQGVYLVYACDKVPPGFCPPGATAASAAEYLWLMADQRDGNNAPPPPAELRYLYETAPPLVPGPQPG